MFDNPLAKMPENDSENYHILGNADLSQTGVHVQVYEPSLNKLIEAEIVAMIIETGKFLIYVQELNIMIPDVDLENLIFGSDSV